MSPNGEAELPSIRDDIAKIRKAPLPGFILIISANPQGETDNNVEWLKTNLPVSHVTEPCKFNCFGGPLGSHDWPACEVFVLGILINIQ